ncbi:MAG: tRNA (guanosine(37)-N1)-methyltransferase TrmD [Patescibacteria group bacterium]|jgi:tRNA (guanine37-N1)-methyltransferase|nr:tRNA (guanosine(37)-N1)-methyltransferase TrmD [Patescibacteria group bacterium]
MKFNVITIFPEIINSYFQEGILKKAVDNKYIKINTINPRDFTTDKHQTVDDTPYGGGAGMLLKIDPLYKALKSIKAKKGLKTKKIVLLSASGKKWNQKKVKEYSKLKELTLISGRYEGVDERIKEFIDEEISIGDYVLTGGELAALTIIDSTTRLIPSVLGNNESIIEESHSQEGIGEYPQYTRPETFKIGNKRLTVPKILLSGDHKKIKEWRENKSKKLS